MEKYIIYTGKILIIAVLIAICVFAFWGCSKDKKPEKTADIKYEIVSKENIPKELLKIIEKREGKAFHLSFSDGKELYLVTGYGKLGKGGCSIKIKDLYISNDIIYMDTELIGPSPEESSAKQMTSEPYIVVKMPYTDKTIYFER